jgi:hypothetical protein
MAKAELKSFGKADEVFDRSFSWQPATIVSTRPPQAAL